MKNPSQISFDTYNILPACSREGCFVSGPMGRSLYYFYNEDGMPHQGPANSVKFSQLPIEVQQAVNEVFKIRSEQSDDLKNKMSIPSSVVHIEKDKIFLRSLTKITHFNESESDVVLESNLQDHSSFTRELMTNS